MDLLRPNADADLRQTASLILARARLSETQLFALARGPLPQADPLILPNLLDVLATVLEQFPAIAEALSNLQSQGKAA